MSKDDTLKAAWSKREKDILFHYPGSATDGRLLYNRLCMHSYGHDGTLVEPLVSELEKRGYDITTLRFTIKRKAEP